MKFNTLLFSLMLLASTSAVSCSNDAPDEPIQEPTGDIVYRINVGVATPSEFAQSRADAHPAHEAGIWHEDDINEVLIVIYDKPINATGGKIVKKIHASGASLVKNESFTRTQFNAEYFNTETWHPTITDAYSQDNQYVINTFSARMTGGDYYVMAFANVGALAAITLDNAGFDALKNYVYNGDLYVAGSSMSENTSFAMAAIDEHKFTYSDGNVVDNTFDITAACVPASDLHVQRLAARIDLSFGKDSHVLSDLSNPEYDFVMDDTNEEVIFPIYDAAITGHPRISGAKFYLDKLSLVNSVTKGGYLLERNMFGSNPVILGSEDWSHGTGSSDPDGYARYHIISPETGLSYLAESATERTAYATCHTAFAIGDDIYAVLGYTGENTFETFNNSNLYTSIKLYGRTNLTTGHFDGTNDTTNDTPEVTDSYVKKTAQFNIRHCYPDAAFDATKPLAYGVVRNTIYRVKIKFYATGEGVEVRYYYYGSKFDGKEDGELDPTNPGTLNENKYTSAKFYNYIIESGGETPND